MQYASYTKLEEEYVLGMGRTVEEGIRLPRHNAESFKNFCSWMCLEKERARSLESTVRMAGSFMTKLKLTDVTKQGDVKAHVKDLLNQCGLEHEPSTTATPRMVEYMVSLASLCHV